MFRFATAGLDKLARSKNNHQNNKPMEQPIRGGCAEYSAPRCIVLRFGHKGGLRRSDISNCVAIFTQTRSYNPYQNAPHQETQPGLGHDGFGLPLVSRTEYANKNHRLLYGTRTKRQ